MEFRINLGRLFWMISKVFCRKNTCSFSNSYSESLIKDPIKLLKLPFELSPIDIRYSSISTTLISCLSLAPSSFCPNRVSLSETILVILQIKAKISDQSLMYSACFFINLRHPLIKLWSYSVYLLVRILSTSTFFNTKEIQFAWGQTCSSSLTT